MRLEAKAKEKLPIMDASNGIESQPEPLSIIDALDNLNDDDNAIATSANKPKKKTIEDALISSNGTNQDESQGDELESLRAGLTHAELAEKIGVPPRTINDWKNRLLKGKTIGPSKHKDKIAQWELNLDTEQWHLKA